jgi:hypothetical protein
VTDNLRRSLISILVVSVALRLPDGRPGIMPTMGGVDSSHELKMRLFKSKAVRI